jgi:WD40 repeat protein
LVQGLVEKTPTSRTTSSQISSDNDRMESFAVDFSQVIYKKMKIICIQFENVSSYSASVDGTINIWNASEGALLYNLDKVHQRTIKTLAFSPDGEMLASGGYDNLINVWKFEVNMPWD